MKRAVATLVVSAGLAGWIGGAAPAAAQAPPAPGGTSPAAGCSAKQVEANAALAGIFDMNRDWKEAYDKMAPGYIQHNPVALRIGEVNGAKGRDEFKLLMELKDKGLGGPPPRMPGQPAEDTHAFVMANCDHVFLLRKSWLPDPQHKGRFYEAFDFDLWRVENGKLAEHWDGARIPDPPPPIMTTPARDLPKSTPHK
jgi:predicted SnoaL-like aldol condensation-catalyzing enzyme